MSESRTGIRRLIPSAWTTAHGFVTLATVSMVGLWLIIPSGGLVRLTKSGLGCPDWPLCNGGVVPEASYHAVIEYTNRLASALVILISVVTWLAARAMADRPRHLRRLALGAVLASLGQIPLGGLTVLTDLHPLMVASHFLLSVVALSFAVILWLAARDHRDGRARVADRRRGPLAWIGAAVLFAVIVSGVLVTAAGPHSGDLNVLKRFGHLEESAWVHVRTVAVLVVIMLTLAIWERREPSRDPFTRPLMATFLPLLVLQIILGEVQYRHGLPWGVIAVHVSVAGLVWIAGLATAWTLARPAAATVATPADAPVADPREAVHTA